MTCSVPPADFYCPTNFAGQESVGYLMKRVMLSVVSQADKRLCAYGLTSAQWGPLLRLQSTGASTVAELARWLQVDAGATTRLLDRLEKKSLVKRVRSTEDRRVVQIELTPAGEDAIREVPAVLCDVMNAHLAGFTESEWVALQTYLKRMLQTGEGLREQPDEPSASRTRLRGAPAVPAVPAVPEKSNA